MLSSEKQKLHQRWIFCLKLNIVIFDNIKAAKKRNSLECYLYLLMNRILRIKYFYFKLIFAG